MKGPHQHDVTTLSTVLLVAANLLIPIAIYVFGTGFFPYKPLLPGLAVYSDSEHGAPPAAPFDRVVFMVVDALRSDFVYSFNSGFEFTQTLIRDGSAIPFTAHATSPTVTMPRIKAITTGSIPSFLDVILNIDEGDESSSLASQDTWLAQMKAKNTGKLVLYGDDTWLKLFPGFFDRADGTSSFFVADFTEVDNNVTRHVPGELQNDDWNTMVLHYLGLDHIGHKGGPRSSNMLPKQAEMDGMVKQIYTAIESQSHLQSTLLVLLGDHGMNDAGNHGGSAPGETSPALVFISPKLKSLKRTFEAPVEWQEDFKYYSVIEQSDLAPTLGALLGFPVPQNNLGAFIADFLPFWPRKEDQAQILMRNAEQIMAIWTATFGDMAGDDPCLHKDTEVADIVCRWRRLAESFSIMNKSGNVDEEWISAMSQWLRDAQGVLSSMASNYDLPRLTIGQALATLAVVLAVCAAYQNAGEVSIAAMPMTLVTGAYGVMMFASSYVEEEHHFWYYTATAWLAFVSWRGFGGTSKSIIGHLLAVLVAMGTLRMMRSWNQTGQKFAGEPDIVKSFLHPEPVRLWALVSITYLWLHRELLQAFDGLPTALSIAGSTGLVLSAFTFKLVFTNEDAPELVAGFARALLDLLTSATASTTLVARAQAVFVGLAIATAAVFYVLLTKQPHRLSSRVSAVEALHHLYTLLAITQSRASNIPLFLLHDVLFRFLAAQPLTLPQLTLSSLLLQYASFFAHGGTNAISSVDLSSAYNGVRSFDVVTVGVLTFVGNWAAPVYWVTATNVLLVRKRKTSSSGSGGGGGVYRRHVTLLTVFAAASVAFVMAACAALRTHLFVWTVFSPKYLYCAAWSLGQHLLVNVGVGGLLYWLGSL